MLAINLPSEVLLQIASNARDKRKESKLSQAALAHKSGVSLGSLKRFESTGQISLESLLKLAFALNCLGDFDQLFTGGPKAKTLEDLLKQQ